MLRYDRSRFVALGLPNLINAMALPLYALGLATGGGRGEDAVPIYLGLAIVCFLSATPAVIKRGRDIGFPAWATMAGLWLGGPLVIGVLLILVFAPARKAADIFESSPPAAGLDIWINAFLLQLWPWIVVLFVSAL